MIAVLRRGFFVSVFRLAPAIGSSGAVAAARARRWLVLAAAASLVGCGGSGGALTGTSSSGTQLNPVPSISMLSPASATAGGGDFTLTVSGSGFVAGSTLVWGSSSTTTQVASATSLSATIPAKLIASAGTVSITVTSPSPGGGTSSAANFDINSSGSGNNPVPAINTLSPTAIQVGSNGLTLQVTGTDFVSGSTVLWNGNALATTYQSATQLAAAVPASLVAVTGRAEITVETPGPGGGLSNSVALPVQSSPAPPPKLVQFNTFQTIGANHGINSPVNTQFTQNTTAGNTLWVAVTISAYASIYTLSLQDTQGNTFTQLDQKNDLSPGWQTVAHFYAPNIVGDSATPDIIYLHFGIPGTPDGFEDYVGMVITEISGVSAAPLVAHSANIQDGLAAGNNNVTSNSMSVEGTQTPALLVALSMNTSDYSANPWTPDYLAGP